MSSLRLCPLGSRRGNEILARMFLESPFIWFAIKTESSMSTLCPLDSSELMTINNSVRNNQSQEIWFWTVMTLGHYLWAKALYSAHSCGHLLWASSSSYLQYPFFWTAASLFQPMALFSSLFLQSPGKASIPHFLPSLFITSPSLHRVLIWAPTAICRWKRLL